MSLVFSLQAYYTTSDAWGDLVIQGAPTGHVTMLETVTVDCDDPDQPVNILPLAEMHIRKCLQDGILTTGMRVSVCVWDEFCDDEMNDCSEILEWFDTHVSNVVDDSTSAWW